MSISENDSIYLNYFERKIGFDFGTFSNHMSVEEFTQRLITACQKENSEKFLDDIYVLQPDAMVNKVASKMKSVDTARITQVVSSFARNLPLSPTDIEHFVEFVVVLIEAAAIGEKNYVRYFDKLHRALESLLRIYKTLTNGFANNWLMPVLKTMLITLKMIALEANRRSLLDEGIVVEKLENVYTLIQGFLANVISIKNPNLLEEKTRITLVCNCQLFWINFKLSRYKINQGLVKGADDFLIRESIPQRIFQKSDIVMYGFMSGRQAIVEDRYFDAVKQFDAIFQLCKKDSEKNIRLILKYLFFTKLLTGILIKEQYMQDYGMGELYKLGKCVTMGDLRTFLKIVDGNLAFWVKRKLIFVIDKLRMLTYRNFFKRVKLLLLKANIAKSQVDLETFKKAINSQMRGYHEYEIDEIECVLANLISQGYIKGYISHKLKKIVFSEKNPFPRVEQVGFKDQPDRMWFIKK